MTWCAGNDGVKQRSVRRVLSAVSTAPSRDSAANHKSRLLVWQRCEALRIVAICATSNYRLMLRGVTPAAYYPKSSLSIRLPGVRQFANYRQLIEYNCQYTEVAANCLCLFTSRLFVEIQQHSAIGTLGTLFAPKGHKYSMSTVQ